MGVDLNMINFFKRLIGTNLDDINISTNMSDDKVISLPTTSSSIISPNTQRPEVSDKSLIERYKSWAYICASKNASRVASVPLRLYATRGVGQSRSRTLAKPLSKDETYKLKSRYKKNYRIKSAEEIEEIYDHPFIDLINYINEDRAQFETLEDTQIYIDITGNAYWYLNLNSLGVPESLQVIPPQYVRINSNEFLQITSYKIGNDINYTEIDKNLIVHFKNPNPRNMFYGFGCLEGALEAYDLYSEMNLEELALNRNLGVPPIVVSYEGGLKQEQLNKIESDWNRALAGTINRGKIKVADNKFDIKQLAFSPREMANITGRKWTLYEMAAAFGVPIDLLITENSNRASAQVAIENYERFTINPRLKRIEDKINETILKYYNEPRLFVAFDENIPENDELNINKSEKLYKAGIITKNEARVIVGLPPVDDEDNYNDEDMKSICEKPYPNEHAFRINNPDKYDSLRRKNNEFGDGIDVIYGILNNKSEVQALRFKKDKWTYEAAKKWVKDHNYNPISSEPAKGE